jgi:hypothetical protein
MLAATLGAAWLSAAPSWRVFPEESALLRVSFSHGGARNCRARTAAELAKLPPNMRGTEICERARAPLFLEIDIDGATLFAGTLPPGGLAGDGPSRVYERFVLPAGPHRIAVRLRDSLRTAGFDHEAEQRVDLAPGQSFVIDFRPEAGGFTFR